MRENTQEEFIIWNISKQLKRFIVKSCLECLMGKDFFFDKYLNRDELKSKLVELV